MTNRPADPVTYRDLLAARLRIRGHVRETPLERSPELSRRVGAEVALKLESEQVTGSFKPRISFSKLLALAPDDRARGVVASTAGGHGVGLAYAAQALGVACDIYLPHDADPRKRATIHRLGARVHACASLEEAAAAARAHAARTAATLVPAYDDPDVVAGGGTVGLEIVSEAPDTDLVIVGMGGGGLAAGIGIALKTACPDAAVWGVQPETSAVLACWLTAGKVVPTSPSTSVAEGLGARIDEGSITFALGKRWVDRALVVSDAEIVRAMALVYEEHQRIVEPSGAAPIAALLRHGAAGRRRIVVVITGRNVARERFETLVRSGG